MKRIKNKLLTLSLVASVYATGASALDLDGAVYIALHKNPDLLAQYATFDESKQNVELRDSDFRPKLDLSYAYNKRDDVNVGANKEDGTFAAKLSYNLFNGFKDISNKQSAKFLSKSSKFSLEALKNDIALDTKKAYINVLDKQNALETFEVEFELFEKQYIDAKK